MGSAYSPGLSNRLTSCDEMIKMQECKEKRTVKSILFVCEDMNIGGVQRSLVSLLKNIDYSKYRATLMLAYEQGALLNEIPAQVDRLTAPELLSCPRFKKTTMYEDCRMLLKRPGHVKSFIKSSMVAWKANAREAREAYWRDVYPKTTGKKDPPYEFDVAIAYFDGMGLVNHFVMDSVVSPLKMTWIHGDYRIFGTHSDIERGYIARFDKIVTISGLCKDVLDKEFNEHREKIFVMENIIDRDEIVEKGRETVSPSRRGDVHFVSVSRLTKEKGFLLALEAFHKVLQEGLNITWEIVGDGPEVPVIKSFIRKNKMGQNVFLLGVQSNPYPYLSRADVFFHPSTDEGKSLSVEEAKIFGKPILVAAYPTVKDQIIDGVTGKVVSIDKESLARGIREMAMDKDLRERLSAQLRAGYGPAGSLSEFYQLIES